MAEIFHGVLPARRVQPPRGRGLQCLRWWGHKRSRRCKERGPSEHLGAARELDISRGPTQSLKLKIANRNPMRQQTGGQKTIRKNSDASSSQEAVSLGPLHPAWSRNSDSRKSVFSAWGGSTPRAQSPRPQSSIELHCSIKAKKYLL